MINKRRPLGQSFNRCAGNDRFVRGLGYALWCAPFVLVLGFSGHFLASGKSARPNILPPIPQVAELVSRPVMTQAILRPYKSVPVPAPAESALSREDLLAMAFMPHVESFVNAPAAGVAAAGPAPTNIRSELTTASTPVEPLRVRSIALENRPWRMQTLRAVGVAQGLRLISDSATLALAGVEPLDPAARCKRLDGVEEFCATRATSRLEVLTRGRTITCRVYEARGGETAMAYCKADKIDLADDLVKNGLARKAA